MKCMHSSSTVVLVAAFFASVAIAPAADKPKVPRVAFKKAQLDPRFRSEGVAVGDFNRDGKLDIAAGSVYYTAPDWQMHAIWEQPQEYDPHKYSNSFCNWAEDVNRDGWTDLIVVDFPGTPTWWFENPGTAGGPWKKHTCTPVTNNESPTFVDVDGDGQRDLVLGFSPDPQKPDGPQRQMGVARRQKDPYAVWSMKAISATEAPSTTKYSHGLGVGDINRDGTNDIVVPQGWWEGKAAESSEPWTFHPANLGAPCSHMFVFDFDGDGDNDVFSAAAHQLGIWWHEQTQTGWQTREISNYCSQTHAVCLADINGDGMPDIVTGKRWWAHGPNGDVNPGDPAVMVWFEFSRRDGKPQWIPHQFDHDSGVGTQFEVADVNADGLLDVVTSNKKGVYYFEQVRE